MGSDPSINPVEFVPSIRSGSFADIGRRRYMEDEHIRIDDLASHLGSLLTCPSPTAFYGVLLHTTSKHNYVVTFTVCVSCVMGFYCRCLMGMEALMRPCT